MAKLFWLALGLVMVLEGLLPALSPALYRRMVQMMGERDDKSLRRIGLVMMIAGAIIIYLT